MIEIKQSQTADTRTCDFASVSKETLRQSSIQHIADVRKGIDFFRDMLDTAANQHDADKLTDLDGFHRDFVGGFKSTLWWDNHRKVTRHHLLQEDGVREDVNLVDVLDMIVDCVMAGMGRAGKVYPLDISLDVLKRAFDNTAELLERNVVVSPAEKAEARFTSYNSAMDAIAKMDKAVRCLAVQVPESVYDDIKTCWDAVVAQQHQ
jgi:hypothetical protein